MIKTIQESRRGCGYRKPGGLYLFAGGRAEPCGRLPIPVHVCPTCGNGVKAGRGFQWIKWEFLGPGSCSRMMSQSENVRTGCMTCPLSARDLAERLGLMWVGGSYYPTPEDFLAEARAQGVSKRIPALPLDFKLGTTWLALAHRKAVSLNKYAQAEGLAIEYGPGIFSLFMPTEVQYVVTGDETEEELDRMVKRGITPVRVEYGDDEQAAGK